MTEFLKRGFPGMQSIKDLPVLQDAPPPGGFPSFRIERRLPSTGPTGITLFSVAAAVLGYGFYQLATLKADKRFQADEILAVRRAVHPVLQAEWDLRYLDYMQKKNAAEAELMKDVPGWKAGAPTTRHRWLPPLESFARRGLL